MLSYLLERTGSALLAEELCVSTSVNLFLTTLAKGMHAKLSNAAASPRAHPCLPRGGAGLFVCAEKVVVRCVRLELSLTHRARCGGSSSPFGVQSLDKGDFGKKLTTRWSFLVPN